MYENDFSNRLAQLRILAGVSARDMSLSLGQSPGYINHIENGHNLPSMSGFFNICEFLKITPEQFFTFDQNDPLLLDGIMKNLNYLTQEQLISISTIVRDLAKK